MIKRPITAIHIHDPGPKAFDNMRLTGKLCLAVSHRWLDEDPTEALAAMHDVNKQLGIKHDRLDGIATANNPHGFPTEATIVQWALCGKWAMSGFPTVDLGQKLAASLMATNLDPAFCTDVEPPWPAFIVRIPVDLGLVLDAPGGPQPITSVIVSRWRRNVGGGAFNGPLGWSYAIMSDRRSQTEHAMMWANGIPAEAIGGDILPPRDGSDGDLVTNVDTRSELLIRRLILGVCIHLAEPDACEASHKGRAGRPRKGGRTPGMLPSYERFELRGAVKVDVREAIRAFVTKGGKSPTVQTLVRGHYRRVAHGPRHSLRRWQRIEPFWRGPEDAPVSNRSRGR